MKKRKICIILTTRGNYAKMKSTMHAIRNHPDLELITIVSGGILLSKYGDYTRIIEADGFKVDLRAYFLVDGENMVAMAKSSGLATMELAQAFNNFQPDNVLVIADRYEALAIAMAAMCMNISITHLEGGELSGSIDERIRHAITKLAHIHLAANQQAADRIYQMGEKKDSIFVVGSPSLDLLSGLDLNNVKALSQRINKIGVGTKIDLKSDYIVVSQHPVVTEYKDTYSQIYETDMAIRALGIPAVWLWPNMDAGADQVSHAIRTFREHARKEGIHYIKSLPMEDYAILLKNSKCLVGNSSSGIRECEYLSVPVVNIGSRQNGRLRGKNVIDVDYNCHMIKEAILKQMAHGHHKSQYLYGNGKAGEMIADILAKTSMDINKRNTY